MFLSPTNGNLTSRLLPSAQVLPYLPVTVLYSRDPPPYLPYLQCDGHAILCRTSATLESIQSGHRQGKHMVSPQLTKELPIPRSDEEPNEVPVVDSEDELSDSSIKQEGEGFDIKTPCGCKDLASLQLKRFLLFMARCYKTNF